MICKRLNKRGFTLAEMMMAVAIIGILAGVSFIAVANYMTSMALLERNGIAKEIFVAAQNHLSAAKGQGYLGVTETQYGENAEGEGDGDIYYVVGFGSGITDVMLPLGSIDETVRGGGNFIIRYQPSSARVLDVFYCSKEETDSRYGHNLTAGDYSSAMSAKGKRDDQVAFSGGILGWYGDADYETLEFEEFQNPTLQLKNDDLLYAVVSNPNSSGTLQVIVEGVTSGASGVFTIDSFASGTHSIVLDDVTHENRRFSNVVGSTYATAPSGNPNPKFTLSEVPELKHFIPGEDIRVWAKAFDTSSSTRYTIGKSGVKTTNSLFEALDTETEDNPDNATAYVSRFRHLENLDDVVSGISDIIVVDSSKETTFVDEFKFNKAVQTADLYWNGRDRGSDENLKGFVQHSDRILDEYFDISQDIHVYGAAPTGGSLSAGYSKTGCYLPIRPSYDLIYDGAGNKICDVSVDTPEDGGLIGSMKGGSISNLELIDFSVVAGGDAGALAGVLSYHNPSGSVTYNVTSVKNVAAYNDSYYAGPDSQPIRSNITATGSAGGLVGSMDSVVEADNGDVDACCAALYVKSTGSNAGGLIGTASGVMDIRRSYSGGHTINTTAMYTSSEWDSAAKAEADFVNVEGASSAGGLIGNVSGADISDCYSTCSVYGTAAASNAGGLIGEASQSVSGSGSVSNCYSTGYVSSLAEASYTEPENADYVRVLSSVGAFIGSLTGVDVSNSRYYMIINERSSEDLGCQYLSPVGGCEAEEYDTDKVVPLDGTQSEYLDFSGEPYSDWTDAYPYDTVLPDYYAPLDGSDAPASYNLDGISRLDSAAGADKLDDDALVMDHYGDWPAPEKFTVNA